MYFIGTGVVSFKGKDYGYGKKLPADFPTETIKSLKAKGKVSDTLPTMGAVAGAADEVAGLRTELAAARSALSAAEASAQDAKTELAAMEAKNKELQTTIEELTKQLTAPAAEASAPTGAGPKK